MAAMIYSHFPDLEMAILTTDTLIRHLGYTVQPVAGEPLLVRLVPDADGTAPLIAIAER